MASAIPEGQPDNRRNAKHDAEAESGYNGHRVDQAVCRFESAPRSRYELWRDFDDSVQQNGYGFWIVLILGGIKCSMQAKRAMWRQNTCVYKLRMLGMVFMFVLLAFLMVKYVFKP